MQKALEDLIDGNLPITESSQPQIYGGGGGGGGYTPPTYAPLAPQYVPSNAVNTQQPLVIYLTTNTSEAVEFFEDGVSRGIGSSIRIEHNPSTAFGSNRKYTAVLNNGKVLNEFNVSIISFPNYYNYTNDLNTQQYLEGISVEEVDLLNNSYNNKDVRTFNFTAGSINLNFKIQSAQYTPANPPSDEIIKLPIDSPSPIFIKKSETIPNPNSEYEIIFSSNLKNELGNSINLSYQLVSSTNDIVDTGIVDLDTGNLIRRTSKELLDTGKVNFQISGKLPNNVSIKQVYKGFASRLKNKSEIDYSVMDSVNSAFSIPASELRNGIVIVANCEKVITFAEPTIRLGETNYDVKVKDSDVEKSITIPFLTENAENVLVYISADKVLNVPAADKQITLYFQKDFREEYGSKRIIFVPTSSGFGTGGRADALLTFTAINDFPSITETTYADLIDVPSFSDFNIEYELKYSTFSASSVDIFLKLKDNTLVKIFANQPANNNLKINLKKLRDNYPAWVGSDNITLILKPYNRSGAEELIGNDYQVVTKLILPAIQLDEDIFGKALFDAFFDKLKVIEPEKESKYLTHLANFGNNEQTLISSWENDDWTLSKKSEDEFGNQIVKREDKIDSIILKLYSPLPANIQPNSTFWVTKLLTNPLIETVILTEQSDLQCPPLKGPNFDIEVDFVKGQSTNYESLDNLILSGSTSSTELVQTYLSASLIDTSNLNVDYVSGSTYLWNNFTHFSSAKERVDNFVYKVQLIETYETAILNAQTSSWINSISSLQQVEKYNIKKNEILKGFDGFENFLYTSSSYTLATSNSMTWPHNGSTRLLSTNTEVSSWYDNIIEISEEYDVNNVNWVQNNIPQYIVNNEENANLVLFFSMIGHHFDNIYFYTKAIEKSRGLGYKSKDGISDKLLFDTLKSFNWDAKNLAADSKLWEYTFGLDSDGNIKNTNPAKQRTHEVWRRIINNLPYLLKHKGTKRGIYALMACYGIPSSNLSILEFGGPEVTETTKSKLVMDNITTAINMVTGSNIQMQWKSTNKGRNPNTIEMFVKPAYAREYQLISGSSWGVYLSGSLDSSYGQVKFTYQGSNSSINTISSSLLPIFNDRFFGVSVSSGSNGLKLDIRQSDKEKTIFQESITASVSNNWNNGSTLQLGGNYIGSVDEFRIWSEVLDTDRFYEHVSFPEMINGNSVSASTADLYFRLDFEYPKNLALSSSLINVDTNIYFSGSVTRNDLEIGKVNIISGSTIFSETPSALLSASAYSFPSSGSYPFNFEAIDRTIVMEYPDGGASRFSTNKIRFESQELIGSLSSKSRATKKAFDQSPTDSNRVGLFFSPTKELNLDIAKSLGGLNLDNYIGDPSDRYKSNYKRLDDLRTYYFQRFDGKDIYAYINLIKLYEKSMFDDIKKMLPARVKATTGLLIEPHILERNKVSQKKPTGLYNYWESEIDTRTHTEVFFENIQKEVTLDANSNYELIGENNQYEANIVSSSLDKIEASNYQYDSLIDTNTETNLISEYYQKDVTIDAGVGDATILSEIDVYDINTIVGQSDYETIGFGIYAQNGHAIRTYFDKDGRRVKERIKADLVKERKVRDVVKFKVKINGQGDPRGGVELTSSVYYETKLNIQPYSGSKVINAGTGSIVEVTPLGGYLPTHYRNTSDLTRGLQNSYYLGSKNTAATTLDGTDPVETFITNPNTLRVNKAGRDASEPILEVE